MRAWQLGKGGIHLEQVFPRCLRYVVAGNDLPTRLLWAFELSGYPIGAKSLGRHIGGKHGEKTVRNNCMRIGLAIARASYPAATPPLKRNRSPFRDRPFLSPLQGHCRPEAQRAQHGNRTRGAQLLRFDLIEAGSKRTRFAIERKHESIQRRVRCHRMPDDKIRRGQRDPRRTGERMELPERAQ